MPRYIDAQKTVHIQLYDEEHEEWRVEEQTIAECLDNYSDEGCPEAADVEEIKHGEWKHGREVGRRYIGDALVSISYEDFSCSVCGYKINDRQYSQICYRFCPMCGAKMDGKEQKNGQD